MNRYVFKKMKALLKLIIYMALLIRFPLSNFLPWDVLSNNSYLNIYQGLQKFCACFISRVCFPILKISIRNPFNTRVKCPTLTVVNK